MKTVWLIVAFVAALMVCFNVAQVCNPTADYPWWNAGFTAFWLLVFVLLRDLWRKDAS